MNLGHPISIGSGFALLLISYLGYSQEFSGYMHHQLDGIAEKNVYEIYQDRSGYMWIGGGSTLHRYDGEELLYFNSSIQDSSSLPPGDIRAIHEDHYGTIWVGTGQGGLASFKDNSFTRYALRDSIGNSYRNSVEQIISLPDSSVLIGSWGGGLFKFKNGHMQKIELREDRVNASEADNVVDILHDPETGITWIGTWLGGLYQLVNDQVQRVPETDDGFQSSTARVFHKTADGTIWIGTWGDGLYSYKNNKYKKFNVETGHLKSNRILGLAESPDGLLVGSWGGGITLFKGSEASTLNLTNGDISIFDFIEKLFIDRNDNLWIGTFDRGASVLYKTPFQKISVAELTKSNDPLTIFDIDKTDSSGYIVVGYDGLYNLEFNDDGSHSLIASRSLPCGINTIKVISGKTIWLGGRDACGLDTVVELDSNGVYSQKSVLDSKWINQLEETRNGRILASTGDKGLYIFDGSEYVSLRHSTTDENSISSDVVNVAKELASGAIAVGTNAALDIIENEKIRSFIPEGIAKMDNDDHLFFVIDLIELKGNRLLIVSDKSLYLFDLTKYEFDDDFEFEFLSSESLKSLVATTNDIIWISTQRHLIRLDLYASSSMPERAPSALYFGESFGVNEYPFVERSSFYDEVTGRLLFGGYQGATSFKENELEDFLTKNNFNNPSTQEVKISAVELLNSKGIKLSPPSTENSKSPEIFRFKHSADFLNIKFSAFEFRPHAIKYSYRLVGLYDEWSDASEFSSATYNNIPPGDYSFEVRASRNGFDWSTPSVVNVVVIPLWYENTWFRAVLLILLLIVVVLINKLSTKFLERQKVILAKKVDEKSKELLEINEQLRKTKLESIRDQEKERKRISREIHDGVSQYVAGASFLLNSKDDEAKTEIDLEVQALLKDVVVETRWILNSLGISHLDEKTFKESLKNLLSKIRRFTPVVIELNWLGISNIDDPKVSMNLFRIIQESIFNACKHSKAEHIVINFENESSGIKCSIADDGIGFEVNSKSEGFGLKNIQERAQDIGGFIKIQSSEGEGTAINFEWKPAG